jgi:phenylalanyl-tRNA synthetase beta chain
LPVVSLSLDRLSGKVGEPQERVLGRLPYIGLDIESRDGDQVRVEYSPNRPDFGTDFGIAKALRGVFDKESGLPAYPTTFSGVSVRVDPALKKIRPFISCAVAKGVRLGDEDLRQVISLQEDLHNGMGRRRRKVAIGLHDLSRVKPPLAYLGVGPDFKFVPLGSTRVSTIGSILRDTEEGRSYGGLLPGSGTYPLITDSEGNVLSFPPVINGARTMLKAGTTDVFIDVTGTDLGKVDDALAIMATTLADAGGSLMTVDILERKRVRKTPDLTPTALPFDEGVVRGLIGLKLTRKEMVQSLKRSRMDVRGGRALAARYRVDLMHPVDVAEEVALGYGFDRIEGAYPSSGAPGAFDPFEKFLDAASTVMAGEGMIELMTFELVDEGSQYTKFGRSPGKAVRVMDPKSIEHSVLRDSLIPCLASALTSNVRSDYPQRVFEIGRVFERAQGVRESWHLACLSAHTDASFTEAKMFLQAAVRTISGAETETKESLGWAFVPGRSASVSVGGSPVGEVGELAPEVIEAFGLRVPVAGFEIDLSSLYKRLK